MIQSIKNLYHRLQNDIAIFYFGYPCRKIKIIGVTGTDGKTTTTHLIYHILKTAGKKVSMISSVYADIAGKIYDTGFHVTTPDVFPLHRFLAESVKKGDEYFVLETTSHALAQNRVYSIKYFAAVLTNITHEHLDFHKTYEEYVKSKLILLNKAKISLINADDRSFDFIKKLRNKKFYSYAIKNKANFRLDISKKINQELPEFNKYNYLAAYCLTRLIGIREKQIIKALKTFKLPPGRLEVVLKEPITVIIDFAHTPNAFLQVLRTVHDLYHTGKNKLIHVFGAAGLRDQSKRPSMGEISAKYSDVAIITEEDYRKENPDKIAQEIINGLLRIKPKITYYTILNRGEAIKKAIEIAKPGDIVITTGKSHEKSLARGNVEYPWDEKKAILNALNKKNYDKL